MSNTMLIEATSPATLNLLQELRALHLIKIIKEYPSTAKTKLSDKYKGVFTEAEAASFNQHVKQMREEWDN